MTVIDVENLSKRYLLSHQRPERYATLRDALAGGVKVFGRRMVHPFRRVDGQDGSAGATEDFYALSDVFFQVRQGNRLGIIGRNGAGKSTMLKILSRITEPTSGRVRIKGRVASLLEVGTGFHPELTGRENIFLNGAILGMSRGDIRCRFDEIVAFAEVEKFLDTPVKRYSSGMYVRLAFAVAAHLEPEILIIDEVLAVGDAQFQKKCLGKMQKVGNEGRTILFVSHNMSIMSALCDKGLLLTNGKVAAEGDISTVISSYLTQMNSGGCVGYTGKEKSPGKPYLKEMMILNRDRDVVQMVNSGDKSTFVFTVENRCRGLSLNFSIYSATGFKILNFNTLNLSATDIILESGRFVCDIDELLLSEGTYWVNVALIADSEMVEHLESVLVFDVCAAPLRGRQVLNANFGTNVLMHHQWTVPE